MGAGHDFAGDHNHESAPPVPSNVRPRLPKPPNELLVLSAAVLNGGSVDGLPIGGVSDDEITPAERSALPPVLKREHQRGLSLDRPRT